MIEAQDYARLLEPLLRQAGGYARSILRNRHDAEDAVQTAALRGLERLSSFDARRPFKGWWFAILHNCCIDKLRQAKRQPADQLDTDIAEQSGETAPDWERLDRALALLHDGQREILRLRYFGELRYAEIAEVLDIPIGTVMSRLHAARLALSARFKEME